MDLATVDLNTGDVKDGVFVYCPRKQHSLFSREGFVMMSQLRSDMLANKSFRPFVLQCTWMKREWWADVDQWSRSLWQWMDSPHHVVVSFYCWLMALPMSSQFLLNRSASLRNYCSWFWQFLRGLSRGGWGLSCLTEWKHSQDMWIEEDFLITISTFEWNAFAYYWDSKKTS